MAIEDINELRQVNGQDQAQRLLDDGWRILAVCVIQDGTSQYAEYHLGRVKSADSKKDESRMSIKELEDRLANPLTPRQA